jgi:signal transduction histidine kinase
MANQAKLNTVSPGANYLDICDAATGQEAETATAFARGIRAVLQGELGHFSLEYPCHGPQEKHWFVGYVTHFRVLGLLRVVVAHEDVTKPKLAELKLQEAHHKLEERVRERTSELQRANALLASNRERLVAMSMRLLEIQEAERRAVARELHDEIGQVLTSLIIQLQVSAHQPLESIPASLLEAKSIAAELMESIRRLSLELRPSMLDDLGLLATLEWHFKRYAKQTGIQVQFEHDGLEGRFSPQIETAVYRMVQEALTNIARYARVNQASVAAHCAKGWICLKIEDKGIGFDAQKALSAHSSSGLSGMRERADLLRGEFQVESVCGRGTRLRIRLPAGEGR